MAGGFLSELAADERADLEALGSVRRYRRGDVLFHQGDDAGAVLVLLEGHVKAAMLNDGREVILAFPGPGELLGELSAGDGEPRPTAQSSPKSSPGPRHRSEEHTAELPAPVNILCRLLLSKQK